MPSPVLVIDDSPSIRQLTRMMLERAGFEVIEAADGEEACGLLDGRPLGMVLCDLAMPRLDGLSFLRLLREHQTYRSVPLVVLSTETRQEQRTAARVGGAQAFIPKPVRPSVLVDTVQRLCH